MTKTLFPGVPRIESPVFGQDTLEDLNEEEKVIARDLNSRGYAVFDFPDPDIDTRISRIQASLASQFRFAGPPFLALPILLPRRCAGANR